MERKTQAAVQPLPTYAEAIKIMQAAAALAASLNSVKHPATRSIPMGIRATERTVATAWGRYYQENQPMFDLLRSEQIKTAATAATPRTATAPRRAAARAGAAG